MKILRIADIPNNRTGGMSRTMYGTGDALVGSGHQVDYLFAEDIGGVRSPRVRGWRTGSRLAGAVNFQIIKVNVLVGVGEAVSDGANIAKVLKHLLWDQSKAVRQLRTIPETVAQKCYESLLQKRRANNDAFHRRLSRSFRYATKESLDQLLSWNRLAFWSRNDILDKPTPSLLKIIAERKVCNA